MPFVPKPSTSLATSLDYLGNVAEFLAANDFEATLADLEEARVTIRRWERWIASQAARGS